MSMTDEELIREIESQRGLMMAVATGGPRIETVNPEYLARRRRIQAELDTRGLVDPIPYWDLWAWYGKWSSGDLPTYQSRREYISGLYQPLLERVRAGGVPAAGRVFEEPTGWPRADRDLQEMRRLLEQAQTEPQFQAVGLFSREILITVAQMVFDPARHQTPDGVIPSATDAKRMLEAFITSELQGEPNEATRRHARAALDVANDLQHRRTATFRSAALCAEATTSVMNLIAIISGRRDPK
jgi:hypothetical protein